MYAIRNKDRRYERKNVVRIRLFCLKCADLLLDLKPHATRNNDDKCIKYAHIDETCTTQPTLNEWVFVGGYNNVYFSSKPHIGVWNEREWDRSCF